jgi:hypothetical protein
MEKIKRWKEGMECKGLGVNMGKTKVMRCVISNVQSIQSVDAVKWPCGVCMSEKGCTRFNRVQVM